MLYINIKVEKVARSTQNTVTPLLFCSVVGLFVAGPTVGENPEEPNHVWILS